jgi:hypothetical protein
MIWQAPYSGIAKCWQTIYTSPQVVESSAVALKEQVWLFLHHLITMQQYHSDVVGANVYRAGWISAPSQNQARSCSQP